ncbi:MAG: hypothetical protein GXO98_05650 [Nitrospirae bacterium]|nr:hypothetical protein [Nitrospirota bacterium]
MFRYSITAKKNRDGFLLFEAILSVAILSFGLVLVLHSFTGSLKAARISQNYMRAVLLLEAKMTELEWKGSLDSGISEGKFSQKNERFAWKIEATPVEEISGEDEEKKRVELNKVHLTVSWSEGKKVERIELTTYLKSQEKESEEQSEE